MVWFIATPVCFLLLFAWNIFIFISISTCVLSTAYSCCCCCLGLCHTACEFFLLWPGIEPMPSAVKVQNPGLPGSFLDGFFKSILPVCVLLWEVNLFTLKQLLMRGVFFFPVLLFVFYICLEALSFLFVIFSFCI